MELMRELNFVHDMDRHPTNYDRGIPNYIKDNFYLIINICKSLVRGATVGTTIGGLAGAVGGFASGSDVGEATNNGMISGAIVGADIDIIQYLTRYIIHRFKYNK